MTVNNKKLLVLSYYWPPASGPGVQRILKFVKYLSELGWEITVITPKEVGAPYFDEGMIKEIPKNVTIIHTKTKDPFRLYNFLKGKKGKSIPVSIINDSKNSGIKDKLFLWIRANLFIPDARVGWNKYALKAAINIIESEQISHLITTGPPHSTHLIGLALKKHFNKLFWVADFRDPWSKIYLNEVLPRTKKTITIDNELETKVIKTMDHGIVVSKQMKLDFESLNSKITVIPNGFDEDDVIIKDDSFSSNKFVLSYIGNFKGNQNVIELWKVIATLINEDSRFKEFFELRLTGRVASEVESEIKKNKIQNNVVFEGFVSHSEAVNKMIYSNLLLFVVPNAKNNKAIITGKLFEYLASKVPLFSIGPVDGDASFILSSLERDEMMDYESTDKLKSTLLNHFNHWYSNNKTTIRVVDDKLEGYTRKSLTKQLSDILLSNNIK